MFTCGFSIVLSPVSFSKFQFLIKLKSASHNLHLLYSSANLESLL